MREIIELRTIMQLRNMIFRAVMAVGIIGVSFHSASALADVPAPVESEERPVKSVRFIIVDDGIEEDWVDHFREQTREKIHTGITEAGFVITDEVTADATVRLSLKVDDAANFIYHFEIEIAVGDQHTVLDQAKCEDCLTDKLVLVAEQQAPRIIDALKVARVRSNAPPTTLPHEPTNEDEKVEPLGPLGGVGIGVAVLGLGATIAGAVEISKGKVVDPDSLDRPDLEFTDHRPAGRALLGVGVAAVTVGVALLVTDVVIRSKKRRGQTSSVRAPFPMIGHGTVGVGLIQKF